MNEMNIYRATTVELQATVSGLDSLAGFTGHFVVKKRFTSDDKLIEVDASGAEIDGMTITFSLDSTDTDIDKGRYFYELAISNVGGDRYIVTQGRLVINNVLTW